MDVDWDHVEACVAVIAAEVSRSEWKPSWIVAIQAGGVIPAMMIAKRLGLENHFKVLNVKSHTIIDWGLNLRTFAGWPDHILIVDDIADSGQTLTDVIAYFDTTYRQTQVNELWIDFKVATLLHKRCSTIRPDFVGVGNMTDEWVNFPWEREDERK